MISAFPQNPRVCLRAITRKMGRAGNILFDPTGPSITVCDHTVRLKPFEAFLAATLLEAMPKPILKERLLRLCWPDNRQGAERLLKDRVAALRRNLTGSGLYVFYHEGGYGLSLSMPEGKRKPWGPGELASLHEMAIQGKTKVEIDAVLHRGIPAIDAMMRRLRIRRSDLAGQASPQSYDRRCPQCGGIFQTADLKEIICAGCRFPARGVGG